MEQREMRENRGYNMIPVETYCKIDGLPLTSHDKSILKSRSYTVALMNVHATLTKRNPCEHCGYVLCMKSMWVNKHMYILIIQ